MFLENTRSRSLPELVHDGASAACLCCSLRACKHVLRAVSEVELWPDHLVQGNADGHVAWVLTACVNACLLVCLVQAAKEHPVMISIEEGSIGGFAAHVMQFLALDGEWCSQCCGVYRVAYGAE